MFKKTSFLFSLLILIEIFLTAYLILERRIPAGHDGFLYFILQYYFLNNAAVAGDIPQWIPYITHGTITTWWYGLQAGILQNILLLLGTTLKRMDFLTLFYSGIFIDKLILLTGTWLLSGRYFSHRYTVFFVTLTVQASTVWYSQPYINLHFYYALPLVIHYLHHFMESGRWRHFVFAGSLFLIHILGNTPYFIPVSAFLIFAYFVVYYTLQPGIWKKDIKNMTWNKKALLSLLFIALLTAGVFMLMNFSTDQISHHAPGREANGTATLNTFLTYAHNTDLVKWFELVLGISPAYDFTLFIGILPLVLIFYGLLYHRSRTKYIFLILSVIFLLFSMATPVAVILYYCWPLMKFYRHLSLLSPLVKIFLCFLAGFGFEVLIDAQNNKDLADRIRKTIFLSLIPLVLLNIYIFSLTFRPDNGASVIDKLVDSTAGLPEFPFSQKHVLTRLLVTSLFCTFTTGLLALFSFFKGKRQALILILLLSTHAFVMNEYHFNEIAIRTLKLFPSNEPVIKFAPLPFRQQRTLSYATGSRASFMDPEQVSLTIFHAPTDAFLFEDELDNSFRTDYWLKAFDDYYINYVAQDLAAHPEKKEQSDPTVRFEFPRQPSALKLSSLTENKIQFFSRAYAVNPKSRLGGLMRDPRYNGDILFISHGYTGMKEWPEAGDLSENQRLNFPYEVKNFSANRLDLKVNVNTEGPVWMFYSDTFHPLWRAKVNGLDTPVFKANLAYKAIQLPPGESTVEFDFGSRLISSLQIMAGCASLWIIGQTFLLIRRIIQTS